MNLDWHRLKAVVFESDDWGLCAWCPDEQAHRVLADTPAFRSETGRLYGRSTLESADDVRRLNDTLLAHRGGDGFPPVWQANTVMAAPDYAALHPPGFAAPELPTIPIPGAPGRWERPQLWEQVRAATESGVWWPELHGWTHVPAEAWLGALRRGDPDARRAFDQRSPVCAAVEASGEFAPAEPAAARGRALEQALARFEQVFGRPAGSLCPPDYRWDDTLEADAEARGLATFQGRAERADGFLPGARRLVRRFHGMRWSGRRFYLPARIAFEPRGKADAADRVGVARVHRAVRDAWRRGQPAIVSSHRMNYAHLDPAWSEAGRTALDDLLGRLTADGAIFLVDAEVRALEERGWSARPIGERGALVRFRGVPGEAFALPVPAGVGAAAVRDPSGRSGVEFAARKGEAEIRLNVGEYLVEWVRG